MNYWFAILISYLAGHFYFRRVFLNKPKADPFLEFFLALGLGLGFSSQIGFYSLLFLNQFHKIVVIGAHLILVVGLLWSLMAYKKRKPLWSLDELLSPNAFYFLILALVLVPVVFQVSFFPMGGWDAWSAWNLKARFIAAGGENWRNLLDPILWRSSPHYPLFLPLINAWGWSFDKTTEPIGPLFTSLLFTFLTTGLLLSALLSTPKVPASAADKGIPLTTFISIQNVLALTLVLAMLSLPFFTVLAGSQYCDLVMGFYLTAGLVCLIKTKEENLSAYGHLAGLFLGLLSFTKSEGQIACGLMMMLSIFYFLGKPGRRWIQNWKLLIPCFTGFVVGVLPTILFQFMLAPGNQTFVNGFLSTEKPATLLRLKMIGAFFLIELISEKWNGLWVLLAIGLLISRFRCFSRNLLVIPCFILFYLLIVGFYYYLNTYFDIRWWLQVSLNRILFALLPVVVLWVGWGLAEEKFVQK